MFKGCLIRVATQLSNSDCFKQPGCNPKLFLNYPCVRAPTWFFSEFFTYFKRTTRLKKNQTLNFFIEISKKPIRQGRSFHLADYFCYLFQFSKMPNFGRTDLGSWPKCAKNYFFYISSWYGIKRAQSDRTCQGSIFDIQGDLRLKCLWPTNKFYFRSRISTF